VINQRFAVEFDRRTVGIAVRVPGGFMFYASDSRFDEMDGQVFRRARAIQRELKKADQKKWKHNRRERLSFAV
jgi:exonuclease I